MGISLSEIRDRVTARVDWAPTQSTAWLARLDGFVNQALTKVFQDTPFYFWESTRALWTQADAEPASTDDTIQLVTEADTTAAAGRSRWVMEATLEVGSAAATQWKTDRTWDGRWIAITYNDEEYHFRIRHVWQESVEISPGVNQTRFRFSLMQPLPELLGAGPFTTWRVYTRSYYLPDDLSTVSSARLVNENWDFPLEHIYPEEAERRHLTEARAALSSGRPQYIWRQGAERIRGPAVAPDVAEGDGGPDGSGEDWLGPEPPGAFQYKITYCWGKRDIMDANYGVGKWDDNQFTPEDDSGVMGNSVALAARHRHMEPVFESPPSPATSTITHTDPGSGNAYDNIQVTVPNIEYALSFLMGGQEGGSSWRREQHTHSGWFVRIYRRRISADFTHYSSYGGTGSRVNISGLSKMDVDDGFYLLAEMNLDHTNAGVFQDTGEILPDYNRRLRDTYTYQEVKFYPRPDDRYKMELRGLVRPSKLEDPQDSPECAPEALDLVVELTIAYLLESEGRLQDYREKMRFYYDRVSVVTKRFSDLRPPAKPLKRRGARSGHARGLSGARRWSNDLD